MSKNGKNGKHPGGRPSKFTNEIAEKVIFLAAKGLTDSEICHVVGVAESTLNLWKKSLEFSESLKDAKRVIDSKVQSALLSRALGYDYEEEFPTKSGAVMCKKKLHPETVACIFWLKNRQPDQWREKVELGGAGKDGEIVIKVLKADAPHGDSLQAPRFAVPDLS